MDINPSVQLDINRWNRVISYKPLNNDGKEVLKDINLKNKDIEEAIDKVVEQSIKKKYINDSYKIYSNTNKKIRITIYSKKEIKLNLVKAEQKVSQKLHFA